jgi:hypothetical protein
MAIMAEGGRVNAPKPIMAEEVAAAELKRMGCPYGVGDLRAKPWLQGYHAATAHALKTALDRIGGQA